MRMQYVFLICLMFVALGCSESRSIENMKRVSHAFYRYHDAQKSFPPPFESKQDKRLLSWRVLLLPYLGEVELYNRFHLDEPWDSAHNKPLIDQVPAVYRMSGSGAATPGSTTLLAIVTSAGADWKKASAFTEGRRVQVGEFTDGVSQTIMFVEAPAKRAVPWTKPADLAFDAENPGREIFGADHEPCLVALTDGEILLVPSSTSPEILRALITPSGDEEESIKFLKDSRKLVPAFHWRSDANNQ